MITSIYKDEDFFSFWLLQGKKSISPLPLTFFQKSKPTDSSTERWESDKDFGSGMKK